MLFKNTKLCVRLVTCGASNIRLERDVVYILYQRTALKDETPPLKLRA
jgi:hypothetical protein